MTVRLSVMRFFLIPLALLAALAAGPARADQTDPRLDALFEALRTAEGDEAEALTQDIRAIWSDAQSDTVDVLFLRAETAADAGRFDLSEALLDHVVGLAPHFAQGWALRGIVRLRADKQAVAIEDLSRALDLEPRQFEASIALAEILLAGGRKAEAFELFQKALEWNPSEAHALERARKLRRDLEGQEI